MSAVRLLLERKSSFRGLSAVAVTSALSGPLCLEVIFAHNELWFQANDQWQNVIFSITWQFWIGLGIFLVSGWSIGRGQDDLSERFAFQYGVVLSQVSALIYLIFGIPFMIWLFQMNLVSIGLFLKTLILSMALLSCSAMITARIASQYKEVTTLIISMCSAIFFLYISYYWFFGEV